MVERIVGGVAFGTAVSAFRCLTTTAAMIRLASASNTATTSSDDRRRDEIGELSDKEVEAFLTSVFLIVGVTVLFFVVFRRANKGRPDDDDDDDHHRREHEHRDDAVGRRTGPERAPLRSDAAASTRSPRRADDDLIGDVRVAVSPESKLLVDGVLPFRHGRAGRWRTECDGRSRRRPPSPRRTASTTTTRPSSVVDAGVLDRMPATKGCNVVVSIREEDLSNDDDDDDSALARLCETLTAIGAEYNLFCILGASPTTNAERTKELVRTKFAGVPEDVLPRHRVVAATTVTGRVAFVRQLRPEVVVDYDAEVEKQLTRFGFRVVLYGGEGGGFGK